MQEETEDEKVNLRYIAQPLLDVLWFDFGVLEVVSMLFRKRPSKTCKIENSILSNERYIYGKPFEFCARKKHWLTLAVCRIGVFPQSLDDIISLVL